MTAHFPGFVQWIISNRVKLVAMYIYEIANKSNSLRCLIQKIYLKYIPLPVCWIYNYLCAIGSYHHWICEFESRSGEAYSMQHYMIKSVRHAYGFFRALLKQLINIKIKPPRSNWNIVENGIKHHNHSPLPVKFY
jgi:hypothetical protein